MEPALTVGLLWLLFGGLHIGLATRRPRAALVARLGERGFTTLFSLARVLLATRLVGAVFQAGIATVMMVGAWHQDRKLLVLRGRPYEAYLAATSAVPFVAILAGRQRLVWRELPYGALAACAAIAVSLRV